MEKNPKLEIWCSELVKTSRFLVNVLGFGSISGLVVGSFVLPDSALEIVMFPMCSCIFSAIGAHMVQPGPRLAQDAPKMAQDGPKMAPRRPQDGPRWRQEGPKMALKWPRGAPRWPNGGVLPLRYKQNLHNTI